MVLNFLPQSLFVISVWFDFEITLILLSPFAEDMQVWTPFDPILEIMTSELGLKFQNLWDLYLEVNIFATKFLEIVILIPLSPFVCNVQIKNFLDQVWGQRCHNGELRDGEASGFCNVKKLTSEMNCSLQIFWDYWFWSFYHCWYIMYEFRSFFTQFGLMTSQLLDKVLKNLKISFINIFFILMFHYL